ncbi:MAG: glycosyltransferase [Candidatus Symbiothrix sp.]|jgi:glycosyltransferase involved in cell wall biosynthesis|nr:glycosyltransferase [Candidatus Symbiothrix sp.]
MESVKVSIVIPVFNAKQLVEKMIQSILVQTYSDWELLLVDDGSDADVLAMLREYASKDARIQVIVRNRAPKSAQTCRNIGLQQAVGKYIVFFDSDDLIAPYCLRQRVDFMKTHPHLDFGVFPAHEFTGDADAATSASTKWGVPQPHDDVLGAFLRTRYPFTVWTNIYRRAALTDVSWDEQVVVYQDFDFSLSVLLKNKTFAYCETAADDYFYRIRHSAQSTAGNYVTEAKCRSTVYLFSKILDRLKTRDDYVRRKKDLLAFVLLHWERLAVYGDRQQVLEYLSFVRKYYAWQVGAVIALLSRLILFARKRRLRKLEDNAIVASRFWYKRYAKPLSK